MFFIRQLASLLLPAALKSQIKGYLGVYDYYRNYLKPKGWRLSVVRHRSVDALDQPIPWITYPALEFLKRVLRHDDRIFEYGSGSSSIWWAQRVAEVVSVEHNPEWANAVSKVAPKNLKVVSRGMNAHADHDHELLKSLPVTVTDGTDRLPEQMAIEHGLLIEPFLAYALELSRYPIGHFNIVVIDGMARVLATWVACHCIASDGVIVFDNSDRAAYNPAFRILADKGFKRIDFYGSGPVGTYQWCTSLFAREFDWLTRNTTVPPMQESDITRALNASGQNGV